MGEASDPNEEQHQKPTDRLGRCIDLAREQKGEKETRENIMEGYRM